MKEDKETEMVELLWSITDKLDKLLAAVEKVCASVAGAKGTAPAAIDSGEPK